MPEIIGLDLFGDEILKDPILRDSFIEPPFSILDTKSGNWQRRKNLWKTVGMKSEVGRDVVAIHMDTEAKDKNTADYTSIFDPALCEVIYKWFAPDGGTIFDPFAGGSVRGIVAHYLGYKYYGIDIRQEQIDSNRELPTMDCRGFEQGLGYDTYSRPRFRIQLSPICKPRGVFRS